MPLAFLLDASWTVLGAKLPPGCLLDLDYSTDAQ